MLENRNGGAFQIVDEDYTAWNHKIKQASDEYSSYLEKWDQIKKAVKAQVKIVNAGNYSLVDPAGVLEIELNICGTVCLMRFEYDFKIAMVRYYTVDEDEASGEICRKKIDELSVDGYGNISHARIEGATVKTYEVIHANVIKHLISA